MLSLGCVLYCRGVASPISAPLRRRFPLVLVNPSRLAGAMNEETLIRGTIAWVRTLITQYRGPIPSDFSAYLEHMLNERNVPVDVILQEVKAVT